jgi:hypothetical protein
VIYVYNIDIQPPWTRPYKKSDIELYFAVFAKWKAMCPEVKENTSAWAFNGKNFIFSNRDIARIPDVEGIQMPGETKESCLA